MPRQAYLDGSILILQNQQEMCQSILRDRVDISLTFSPILVLLSQQPDYFDREIQSTVNIWCILVESKTAGFNLLI